MRDKELAHSVDELGTERVSEMDTDCLRRRQILAMARPTSPLSRRP